ncbi:MAG: hypothetical protein IKM29_02070 [Clostridia bacterium]|nr:hypothetical protein [Clostridia bacterium]
MSEYNQQPVSDPRAGKGAAIASMVLGIMSVAGSWTAVVGAVLSIVALILAGKAKAAGNRSVFAKVGRITGIIGLIIAIMAVVVAVIYFIFIIIIGIGGAAASIVDFAELFEF